MFLKSVDLTLKIVSDKPTIMENKESLPQLQTRIVDSCREAKVSIRAVEQSKEILNVVQKYSKHYKVKSRNITNGQLDMVVEVRTSDDESFVQEMSELNHVHSVSLLSHDGEVTF